jgi:hypothetical protein
MYSPSHQLIDGDLQIELHQDICALGAYSVIGLTWEISLMWVFEWWWEQIRLSCRYNIREKSQMNLPARLAIDPFVGHVIKN